MLKLTALWITALIALIFGSALHADSYGQHDYLLPERFPVYAQDGAVTNNPDSGLSQRQLPTINLFKGRPGGYIACYSHHEAGSAYSVGDSIYVMGQIRLPGRYEGRIFQPKGYRNRDISAQDSFKALCTEHLPSCQGDCWAGGDTGGWFGIP